MARSAKGLRLEAEDLMESLADQGLENVAGSGISDFRTSGSCSMVGFTLQPSIQSSVLVKMVALL